MTTKYIEAVLEIETQNFSQPWTAGMFLSELENPNAAYFAAVEDEVLLGYGGLLNIAGEGHVTNIAVQKQHMGKGLGRHILSHLEQTAKEQGCFMITLEVRQSNAAALGLYKSFGFLQCGIRKDYYQHPIEDAVIMSKELVL